MREDTPEQALWRQRLVVQTVDVQDGSSGAKCPKALIVKVGRLRNVDFDIIWRSMDVRVWQCNKKQKKVLNHLTEQPYCTIVYINIHLIFYPAAPNEADETPRENRIRLLQFESLI